jgi:hypothetical protein
MNLSDLIIKLLEIKYEHGDLEVVGDRGAPDVAVINEQDETDKCVYIG